MSLGTVWLVLALISAGAGSGATMSDSASLVNALTPQPQQLCVGPGHFRTAGARLVVTRAPGRENAAGRGVVREALELAGAEVVRVADATEPLTFAAGAGVVPPELPARGPAPEQAYVLAIEPEGISARAASAEGLLYAAQTLKQIARVCGPTGRLPCLTIFDWPEFRWRGLYIEGGQERFGRIVQADYLCEQIRRLSEFRMNALVIECYNLFPFASFPECADEGTLTADDARRVIAESRLWHVTLIPSLQTLAQAYELIWQSEAGVPYRETTAPGLICPSTPEVYPFIKGLYRDLLRWFPDAPFIGIGCSEIDMQWQGRYCPKCQGRVDAGETVRDLLLGHAEKCITAVHELSAEMQRPVQPMMWGDEFYMYGPSRDWVGLERIPPDVVMGYWKYWPGYAGIEGLMARGYDVFGVSAMYNHCFYLADLSPTDPPKSWPSMEQTGVLNITEMVQAAGVAQRAHPGSSYLGGVAASFSKHRLRAFDSIWYGFALNGHCMWSHPDRPFDDYQGVFTRAFTRHYYDARTDEAARLLAEAYERLDRCKSALESANQTLHDVVGVVDTQEAGYLDNSLTGAFGACAKLFDAEGNPLPTLAAIDEKAARVALEAKRQQAIIDDLRPLVGATRELGELWLAAEQIATHAERELLMIDTHRHLTRAVASGEPLSMRVRSALTRSWEQHRERTEAIRARVRSLYSRGDPTGLEAVLRDIRSIEEWLAQPPQAPGESAEVLLDESFATLDAKRWLIRGEPDLADGHLGTRAPGGWENYSGIATREAFPLDAERPLVVDFTVTPMTLGADSPLFGSAQPTGELAPRFALAGAGTRFLVHTQYSELPTDWRRDEAGWKCRGVSPPVAAGTPYRVRVAITQRSFQVSVYEAGQTPESFPFWTTGPVPMDELAEARLVFADVEPPGSTASTRWGPIRVWRPGRES